MKPVLHLGDTSVTKYIDKAARKAGPRATLTDAPFVADVTGKAGDRDLERLAKSDSEKDQALLKESVGKTGAVVANMKGVAKDKLKESSIVRVLRAAFKANVPVMLEGADAELMAELLGIGLGYEAVIIEPSGDANDCHITYLGESYGDEPSPGEVSEGSVNQDQGDAPPEHIVGQKIKNAPDASDPEKIAAKFQHIVETRPYAAQKQRDKKKLGLLGGAVAGDKAGGYLTLPQKSLPVTVAVYNDSRSDTVAVDITFKWSLVRGGAVDGKYLQIKPEPVSVNPYPMAYDESNKKGAFTEKMVLTIANYVDAAYPAPPSLTLQSHEPVNVNNVTTYCYSTGFTATAQGVSFSPSSSVTTTIQDFTITDNSAGAKAEWIINLSMTDGGANPNGAWTWDNWIKALPPLATNNFTVMADSVFRVDPSFMGQLYFTSTLDLTVGWYFTAPASKTITRKRGSCNGKYTQWMRVNFGNFGLMW